MCMKSDTFEEELVVQGRGREGDGWGWGGEGFVVGGQAGKLSWRETVENWVPDQEHTSRTKRECLFIFLNKESNSIYVFYILFF